MSNLLTSEYGTQQTGNIRRTNWQAKKGIWNKVDTNVGKAEHSEAFETENLLQYQTRSN